MNDRIKAVAKQISDMIPSSNGIAVRAIENALEGTPEFNSPEKPWIKCDSDVIPKEGQRVWLFDPNATCECDELMLHLATGRKWHLSQSNMLWQSFDPPQRPEPENEYLARLNDILRHETDAAKRAAYNACIVLFKNLNRGIR